MLIVMMAGRDDDLLHRPSDYCMNIAKHAHIARAQPVRAVLADKASS